MGGGTEPLLASEGASSPKTWSALRRGTVVATAILACFFNAGLAFGFSALLPVLLDNGAFGDLCGKDAPAPCDKQNLALTGMFTLATSMLNIMALPTGALQDKLGPKLTAAICASVVAIGCVLFSMGGQGPTGHLVYNVGFLLLAVGGPGMFNCTISFQNLFPGMEGFIAAGLVGCFDASSAIFVFLAEIVNSGVTFQATFIGYAIIPTSVALISLALWPRKAVEDKEAGGDDLSGDNSFAKKGIRGQVCSIEFLLMCFVASVNMVNLNFFIATVLHQMQSVKPESARQLSQAFSAILPAGGFVYIPVIGFILKMYGTHIGFVVLWAAFLAFGVLLRLYAATGGYEPLAYAAFVIFAFCRPLFYTLAPTFIGQTFGFATLGTIYGLVSTCAGIMNSFVSPLSAFAGENGFPLTNDILQAVQAMTIVLPLFMLCRKTQAKVNTIDSIATTTRMRSLSYSRQ